ncbi:MAG: flagellar biosynthesis protein FlhF, partial [Phycisphaerales bacterium]
MAEALRKVKKHLGRDAVIVSTRTVSRGGILGFGAKRFVEITAARQMADLPAPLRRGAV